jgi:hypothetical protein
MKISSHLPHSLTSILFFIKNQVYLENPLSGILAVGFKFYSSFVSFEFETERENETDKSNFIFFFKKR